MKLDLAGRGMYGARARERLIDILTAQGIRDPRVLEAIREVPRHLFVDEAMRTRAYDNDALPIGFDQTISQPYTVARMTEVLIADGIPQRVLEVGTGSGYQAAVLARLVPALYTVERIVGLYERTRKLFHSLRSHGVPLGNITMRHADGGWGWPELAPFDAIIVTAASPELIPQPLLQQMAVGGRMVLPLGRGRDQKLLMVRRDSEGFSKETLEAVTFVPLLGGAA